MTENHLPRELGEIPVTPTRKTYCSDLNLVTLDWDRFEEDLWDDYTFLPAYIDYEGTEPRICGASFISQEEADKITLEALKNLRDWSQKALETYAPTT